MGVTPSGTPEAELWFGAHPLSECSISVDDQEQPFAEWLDHTAHSFPLLVKFLAASLPLSIQVHPNLEAAHEGFQSEEAAGVALAARERTFKDPHPKPELMIPLSEHFDVLWGIQDSDSLTEKLQRWHDSGLASRTAEGLREVFHRPLQEAFASVMGAHPEVSVWIADLADWSHSNNAVSDPVTAFERGVMKRLISAFPGDSGIVIATVMHQRRVVRGEAVFVKPGEIHAYVEGFAVEVMLPSDNVARAGLTTKHVDPEVFLALADLTPHQTVPVVVGKEGVGGMVFEGEQIPFVVTEITGGCVLDLARDSVLVVEQPGLTHSVEGVEQPLEPGLGYFVGHSEGPHHISGHGIAWLVEPRSPVS